MVLMISKNIIWEVLTFKVQIPNSSTTVSDDVLRINVLFPNFNYVFRNEKFIMRHVGMLDKPVNSAQLESQMQTSTL